MTEVEKFLFSEEKIEKEKKFILSLVLIGVWGLGFGENEKFCKIFMSCV